MQTFGKEQMQGDKKRKPQVELMLTKGPMPDGELLLDVDNSGIKLMLCVETKKMCICLLF